MRRRAPTTKYKIIPTKIRINPQDETDLLKHQRIATYHGEIIYRVEHHVQVEITVRRRSVTPLYRGERVGDDGGEVVGVDRDDGPNGVSRPSGERAPFLLLLP